MNFPKAERGNEMRQRITDMLDAARDRGELDMVSVMTILTLLVVYYVAQCENPDRAMRAFVEATPRALAEFANDADDADTPSTERH